MPLKLSQSFRRDLIDHALNAVSSQFSGAVLDLGGKKNKKRGMFRPPENSVQKWVYLNLDLQESPDAVGSAESIPYKDSSFDWIVCTEVLEYVSDPSKMISEMHRVLKTSGKVFLTAPFLYQIHGKPHDLQRFTNEKLKSLFLKSGFAIEVIEPQGHFFLVLADFIRAWLASIQNRFLRYIAAFFFYPDCLILSWLDKQQCVARSAFLTSFTTGYVLIAKKAG